MQHLNAQNNTCPDLYYKPMFLNVRHLFTSIGDILVHKGEQENGMTRLVSDQLMTEKSGLTQTHGIQSYATWVEKSKEVLYDYYHEALGE